MMAAYMDNMAYYYRVNDDTVMETTGWTEKLVEELLRSDPPNVGVVGPWFKEGLWRHLCVCKNVCKMPILRPN